MDTNKAQMLVGAFRTILAGVLGWVVAKGYITSDVLNTSLLAVGTIALCIWSLATKQGPATEWYPYLLGAGRNLLAVGLTYASGMGWIAQADVAPMLAAFGTLAVVLWSTEAKYLSVGVRRIAPMIIVMLFLPAFLMGCAGGPFGNDAQQTVYNAGQDFLGPLDTVGAISQNGLVPIPSKVCTALGLVTTAYHGAELTVRDPNFQTGTTSQQVIVAFDNALSSAVLIIVEVAASAHTPMKAGPPRAALTSDPTADQWDALDKALVAGVAGVHCTA